MGWWAAGVGGCALGSRTSLAPYVPHTQQPVKPTAFRRNQQPKTQGQRNEIKAEVMEGWWLLSGRIGLGLGLWLGFASFFAMGVQPKSNKSDKKS